MLANPLVNSYHMQTHAKSGIYKKKVFFNTKHKLPNALVSGFVSTPTSYTQAFKFHQWRQAMDLEFSALQNQQTWVLVPHSPNMNVVGCKWVYRTKLNADESLNKHKARSVAKGFHQVAGVDFAETFSPVVKHATIRIVLALAVNFGWSLRQLDVECAFLHGILQEEVFMEQPQGFVDSAKFTHVCKMLKSIYCLSQAPRAWYVKFSSKLEELGFHMTIFDPSLFVYHKDGSLVYLLLYVDDIIITGNCHDFIQKIIDSLNLHFHMKDMGALSYFLGISITTTSNCLKLYQSRYIADILDCYNMSSCKLVTSPATTQKLSKLEGLPLSDPSLYRSMVGALQYITLTRPDISFAVNQTC